MIAFFALFVLTLVMAGCSNSSSPASPGVTTSVDNPGGGTSGKTAATISFAESDVGNGAGEAAFTNALTNTGNGAVTFSSSNTGTATVDAATGQVTIVAEGTAAITAACSWVASI